MALPFPDVARVLIIKPSSLGDIVHALPVLAGLRAAHPRAHIAWLVAKPFVAFLDGHPMLDEVIPFDRKHYGRMWRSPRAALDFLGFCLAIRRRNFDLIIDLQGLFRSGFLAWVGGAQRRVGFADARELSWLFMTQRVRGPWSSRRAPGRRDPASDVHAVEKNLHVARALGLAVDPPQFPLGLRDAESEAARALLAAAGVSGTRFIALAPGARWESKRWPVESWAALIDRLHAGGGPTCVLLGGPDERALADAIVTRCRTKPANLIGRTSLRELTALLALAERVICCDSGPMHMTAALARPMVALFGPTNAARTGPYGRKTQVLALPLDCSPCYARVCPLRHHACMRQLSVEQVASAALQLR
jgi:lipopolysaccharide heptosyltransferase I